MMYSKSESGNVLFLILIAVALFAALSFAITNSTRGGSGNLENEEVSLQVSQALQYVTAINSGMTLLKSRGYSIENIKFCDGVATQCDNNLTTIGQAICRTGPDCLFAPEGGSVIFQEMPEDLASDPTLGPLVFEFYESTGAGVSARISSGQNTGTSYVLKSDVCSLINEKLGVTLTTGSLNTRPTNGYEPMYCECSLAATCPAGSMELYFDTSS